MNIKLILFLLLATVGIRPTSLNNLTYYTGTYYDYLVIETSDGREWLLEDLEEEYQDEKVPFLEGDQFLCIIDTMGTTDTTDDELLYMQYIE